MPGYIHHIQWCVKDAKKTSRQLTECFGFSLTHQRHLSVKHSSVNGAADDKVVVTQNVVQSGDTIFVLTQNDATDAEELCRIKDQCESMGHFPVSTCCATRSCHQRDTVFNVCLEVGDVETVTERVRNTQKNGLRMVLTEPKTVKSEDGSQMSYSVVRSCCGNVIHTVVNTSKLKVKSLSSSSFLPGFTRVSSCAESNNNINHKHPLTTQMDHVTYVCRAGESKRVLEWYASCFGMQRFLVNSLEAMEDDGVEIGEEVGMRMTVGEWISSWLCREEGVHFQHSQNDPRNFKLVLAEPLEGRDDSHVQHFINNHGGPGLQHIGLTAAKERRVEEVVEQMSRKGAEFRRPPPTYYKLADKVREIESAGGEVAKYLQLGLLLDSEADFDDEDDADSSGDIVEKGKYLIQIFTKPMFGSQEDTFFLEILERRGARGFGAGNITALAKSIIEYKKSLNASAATD